MIIERIGSGPFPDYSIDGDVLHVADCAVDINARQQPDAVIVDINSDGENIGEGIGDIRVASIIIPPQKSETVANGDTETTTILPANLDAVRLKLWS